MAEGEMAKVGATAVACLLAGLWGYCVPSYVSEDARWRLLAVPVGLLAGAIVWFRPVSAPTGEVLAMVEATAAERTVVTVGAAVAGAVAGVVIPLVLTRAFPRWTVALPLALTLALLLASIAWNNPAMFFKDRRF